MTACGLDFGTSNSTLGLASATPALVALEGDDVTLPSAIFYARDAAPLVGRAAIAAYVDGHDGRLMRSLKAVLGNPLINETTQVGRARVGFRSVIAHFIAVAKRRAEARTGYQLEQVVHGRPVHFVDGDAEGDRKAEGVLAEIAREVGFSEISFQYEPIAAALDYERQVNGEEIALIADIGGGTSDFSIVRLGPERRGRAERADDILANDGVRIGGTDFDRQLNLGTVMPMLGYRSAMKRAGLPVPSGYFHDLATWSTINRLYERGVMQQLSEVRREARHPEMIERLIRVVDERGGHRLAIEVEAAKIALSDTPAADIPLDWIEQGLEARVTRDTLVMETAALAAAIADRIKGCLAAAGLKAEAIDAVFLTGGSTRLAHVRKAILAAVPEARPAEGDTFGSVGMGLTIEAANRYGAA
ncbi:Hsp70 family protein [Mesorhizobium sp. BR1-1-16]|uniref:Hsp70 family protein n=1 Tax=Mesorhizobium sp. BR1-1-16 TaxID=2876653 RepID=UPI001CCFDED4|nr:Hsp70 family protein [Mesorhizobium sp. BR1-1-16]MBZ9937163.1 Hsp70 family protein [Mesorhizobium sp. BR1-1-16]